MASAPTSPKSLFDFSKPEIQEWEVQQIAEAANSGKLTMSQHALEEAIDDGIDIRDIYCGRS